MEIEVPLKVFLGILIFHYKFIQLIYLLNLLNRTHNLLPRHIIDQTISNRKVKVQVLPLTIREIYFTGVMSLIIIIVSAFFVGMVLGLQGYYTLQKYGSSEAIGVSLHDHFFESS